MMRPSSVWAWRLYNPGRSCNNHDSPPASLHGATDTSTVTPARLPTDTEVPVSFWNTVDLPVLGLPTRASFTVAKVAGSLRRAIP